MCSQRVRYYRPDRILVDRISRQATLFVKVAIQDKNSLCNEHDEKNAKYRELETQTKGQRRMEKVQRVPIIISKTGIIRKNLLETIICWILVNTYISP